MLAYLPKHDVSWHYDNCRMCSWETKKRKHIAILFLPPFLHLGTYFLSVLWAVF